MNREQHQPPQNVAICVSSSPASLSSTPPIDSLSPFTTTVPLSYTATTITTTTSATTTMATTTMATATSTPLLQQSITQSPITELAPPSIAHSNPSWTKSPTSFPPR